MQAGLDLLQHMVIFSIGCHRFSFCHKCKLTQPVLVGMIVKESLASTGRGGLNNIRAERVVRTVTKLLSVLGAQVD